jgi:Na+/H+-translocating membrane pyrophosphatase
MDFLAGILFGVGVTGAACLILLERAMTAVDKAVKSLEAVTEERRNQETCDDADRWKLGRTEEDDE